MKIAYISTHPPRECGLATFNHNLMNAINANYSSIPDRDFGFVVAMNNSKNEIEYVFPSEVKFVIRENHQKDYDDAAQFINSSNVDACVLQHEFGIFGGENGIYVLPFINKIEKPLISIFHTVLKSPTFLQKVIICEVAKRSEKVVVMSKHAVKFLIDSYQIPKEKIKLIEHGVPNLEAPSINPINQIAKLKNKRILLTFGLLSRNKGLETVIKALPKIVAKHPDAMYVILGKTHPGVVKNSGEEYRDFLKQLAVDLKVDDHLLFINDFVGETDLINYLTAADVYITPYLNEAQITSGTLSYAIGAGAAVVSTPYWHAQELSDNGLVRLFKFKDDIALSEIINELLGKSEILGNLKAKAYQYGLKIRWPKIGNDYISVVTKAVNNPDYGEKILHQIIDLGVMPEFSLEYIHRLTDDTGIFQHAKYGIPNRKEGYCLDDNSRALIMALMAYQQSKSQEALNLLPVYLSYTHDMQLEDGNFRNFSSFGRQFLDEEGSDDSFGRTIWSLGYLIYSAPNNSYAEFGTELFAKAVPHFEKLTHLRGICNTITGLSYFLQAHPFDEAMKSKLIMLTEKLMSAYHRTIGHNWQWFENHLTYDNAIFPLSLLHSAEITKDEKVEEIALEALHFLEKLTLNADYLNPVGNNGWFFRDGEMPLHDQQAIETMAMVLMYFQAYKVTEEPQYIKNMFQSYLWFLGENSLRVPLYDTETKGCCDGLQASGINRNQGAESTLAYLISHLTVLDAFKHEYEYNQDIERQKSLLFK